uniref:BACK domain-containing protein n=1 Tax=Strigamia maritima TaxID=126957 RepID=T1IMT1_STRMM
MTRCQILKISPTRYFQHAVLSEGIRYIYTDELRLDGVRAALDILYAAHKYMLYHLASQSMHRLSTQICCQNVLEVYQEVRLYDVEMHKGPVILKCLQTIDKDANEMFKTQAFGQLDSSILRMILSREFLQVASESAVFDAVSYWSSQECRRRKLELSNENRRKVLGKALFLVQYLAMSREEFLEGPSASGLLTDEECQAILARIYGDESAPLPAHLRRRQLKWKRSLYFCYPVKFYRNEPNLFPSQKQEESVIVVTNQDIVLLGFDLYGPASVEPNSSYKGALHLVVNDTLGTEMGSVQWNAEHVQPLKDTKLYVAFEQGVLLKARKKYKIQVYLPKGEYWMGENWEGTTTSKYKCRSIDFAVKYCRKDENEADTSDDDSFAELDSGSDEEANPGNVNVPEKANAIVQEQPAMAESQEYR